MQQAQCERADLLQVEEPVFGHDGFAFVAAVGVAGRERQAQADVRGPGPDAQRPDGCR